MDDTAVYAGSFDPPTNGHAWMIEQGSALFGKLIVAAAVNPEKHYTYPVEQRIDWLQEIAKPFPNVEVTALSNQFLAHYARDQGARNVLRGIRNHDDYQYERAMRYVNSDLFPGLTSVFLMPPRELCETSSSLVKGMIGPEGWQDVVRRLVPTAVFGGLVEQAAAEHPADQSSRETDTA